MNRERRDESIVAGPSLDGVSRIHSREEKYTLLKTDGKKGSESERGALEPSREAVEPSVLQLREIIDEAGKDNKIRVLCVYRSACVCLLSCIVRPCGSLSITVLSSFSDFRA